MLHFIDANENPNFFFHPDFFELSAYLGPAFRLDWCNSLDNKCVEDANDDKYLNREHFARNTMVYAYQNIGLSVQGIHRPYIAKILEATADYGANTIIDVGAGGGQIGLALHTLGYKVSFAEIYSQSFLWLAWRLNRRGLGSLDIYDLDNQFEDYSDYEKKDIAVCFDVMEHLSATQQTTMLERLPKIAKTVFVNLIPGDGTELENYHFPLDMDALTNFCRERWNVWSGDYYPDKDGKPRQRLLIYGEGVRAVKDNL